MGQEFPESCRTLKFVVGSFELDYVLLTEAGNLDSFYGNFVNTYRGTRNVKMRMAPERLSTSLPEGYVV